MRAEDPPTDRYIPRGKQHWEEKPASIFYARTTGIWQTVWAEPVPHSYLESVRITPGLEAPLGRRQMLTLARRTSHFVTR